MSVLGYRVRNHVQQVRRRGADPDVDDRATTPEVFDPLHARFGFTLDVAALSHNTKCARFYTPDDDGLVRSWAGHRVWCNPPYSNIRPWVERAWREYRVCPVIVFLLPANRTEQAWWQDLVEPHRDRPGSGLTVEFFPGRLRFIARGASGVGPNERPPFGSCLLVWRAPAQLRLFEVVTDAD